MNFLAESGVLQDCILPLYQVLQLHFYMARIEDGLDYVCRLSLNIKECRCCGRGKVYKILVQALGIKCEMRGEVNSVVTDIACRLHHSYIGGSYTGQCTFC